MGQKTISPPVAAVIVAIVVVLVGVLLYRGMVGGTVGDGKAGNVEASPPMPDAAKQQMLSQHGRPAQGGAITP